MENQENPIVQKHPKWLLHTFEVVGVLLCIGVAGGIFYFWQYDQKTREIEESLVRDLTAPIPKPVNPQTASSTDVQGKSGIKGTVTIGPTCPVMRDPPDPQCADKPYQAVLNVVGQAGVLTVVIEKTFTSNKDGTFAVELEPGNYTVSNAGKGTMPTLSAKQVTVIEGKYTNLNLQFDSGIR